MNSLYNVCLVCDKIFFEFSFNSKKAFYLCFENLYLFKERYRYILRHLHNLQHYEVVKDYLIAIYKQLYFLLSSASLRTLRIYYDNIKKRFRMNKRELVHEIVTSYFM